MIIIMLIFKSTILRTPCFKYLSNSLIFLIYLSLVVSYHYCAVLSPRASLFVLPSPIIISIVNAFIIISVIIRVFSASRGCLFALPCSRHLGKILQWKWRRVKMFAPSSHHRHYHHHHRRHPNNSNHNPLLLPI